jgi:hypothetical protein
MMILSVFVMTVFRIFASVLEYPDASIFMLEDLGALSAQDIKLLRWKTNNMNDRCLLHGKHKTDKLQF